MKNRICSIRINVSKYDCSSTGDKKKREKYDVIFLSLNWLYFTVLTRNSDVGIDLRFLRL